MTGGLKYTGGLDVDILHLAQFIYTLKLNINERVIPIMTIETHREGILSVDKDTMVKRMLIELIRKPDAQWISDYEQGILNRLVKLYRRFTVCEARTVEMVFDRKKLRDTH